MLEKALESIENRVLYIVADNTEKSRERLDEEFREIQRKLELARMEDRFPWRVHYLPENLGSVIREHEPKIVHLTGYSGGPEALMTQDYAKKAYRVQPDALIAVFKPLNGQVECVVLSACFSKEQANAIASQVKYVIGIPAAVSSATTDFSIEFYHSLGAGRSIEEAYEIGCNQLRLQGIPASLIPVLIKKN
jgi:hypothetical protein